MLLPRTSSLILPLLVLLVCCPALLIFIESTLANRHHSYRQDDHRYERQTEVENEVRLEAKNGSGAEETLRREMATRMASRRATIKEACSRNSLDKSGNDSLHRPNPWEFLINKEYHLVWCNIFKAASTSWMYNFNLLAGYKPSFLKRSKMVPLQLARRKYPRPTLAELKAALNDSIAFLIVRHPLERLLSAYRDKIENALSHTPHQKLGNEIILKYRHRGDQNLQKNKKKKTAHNPRWPSISEFVNYLVDTHRKGEPMDMHWAPMTEFCTPCQINFDIIIKFETFQEDQQYLIDLAGVGKKIKPVWKNPSKGRDTTDVLYNYYSQLTVTQVLKLHNLYRYDFELFGYSVKEYLEMARPDE